MNIFEFQFFKKKRFSEWINSMNIKQSKQSVHSSKNILNSEFIHFSGRLSLKRVNLGLFF